MKTGQAHQERLLPSTDLRLSTEKALREDEEHQKLNTELRTLQQQLEYVIQQISQVLDNFNITVAICNRLPICSEIDGFLAFSGSVSGEDFGQNW